MLAPKLGLVKDFLIIIIAKTNIPIIIFEFYKKMGHFRQGGKDKKLEVVILTYKKKDHLLGLVDVFKNYKVDCFLANQVENSTPSYSLLKTAVRGSKARTINPYVSLDLRYGLIYLDIFSSSKLK